MDSFKNCITELKRIVKINNNRHFTTHSHTLASKDTIYDECFHEEIFSFIKEQISFS